MLKKNKSNEKGNLKLNEYKAFSSILTCADVWPLCLQLSTLFNFNSGCNALNNFKFSRWIRMSPRFFYANEEAETELVWVSEIEIGLRRVEQEEVILFPDKKAAVLITRSQKHDHITSILTEQHRLPVSDRIGFKFQFLLSKGSTPTVFHLSSEFKSPVLAVQNSLVVLWNTSESW